MQRRALIQAYRLAGSTPMGTELISFLRRRDIVRKLREAAERGTQPMAAISAELLVQFPTVIHDPAVRRRIGFFVSAILDGEGFGVERTNVRMKNSLFKSGAVYKKRPDPKTTPPNAFARLSAALMDALTEDEARQLVELLGTRFPALKKRGR
jgi:ATP-dependent exoDNAse (exonuclease V) alpha subunit